MDAQRSAPLAATAATAAATTAAPGPQAARGKIGRGRKLLFVLAFLVPTFAASAYIITTVMNAPAEIQLSGRVVVSTPLTAATVNVYEMRSDGQPGLLLATTTTDEDGYYSASVLRHPSSWLLVITSGGGYVDDISQDPLLADPNNSLKTILRPESNYASLTPLTTFATARASSLAESGEPLRDSFEVSYAAVARQYNLEAIVDIDPATADDPQDVQVSGRVARQYGLILAGLGEEANTLGVTDFALSDAVAQDISDGTLDGKAGATPILIEGGVSLPADTTTTLLQDAINTFAASPDNLTYLPAPQISLKAPQIDLNTGGLAYVSPNVLPAWVDGRAGEVTLSGKGGTLPYTCELASGVLPEGFSLSKDCALSGNGTPVLGSGSSMLIGGAFTVRMSDASQPPQSVNFDLRITIVRPGPVIAVSPGTCPQAGKDCSITIASATGGTPGYYYTTYMFHGSAPMGMIVDLDGVLTGKPARAGTYTVGACVVDLVGASDCATTTVTVLGGPSPTPIENNLPAGFPTDLPSGTYSISICIDYPVYPEYNSCTEKGTYVMADLAEQVSQEVDYIKGPHSTFSVQYTTFNGTYFDLVITNTAEGVASVTVIRITKVG